MTITHRFEKHFVDEVVPKWNSCNVTKKRPIVSHNEAGLKCRVKSGAGMPWTGSSTSCSPPLWVHILTSQCHIYPSNTESFSQCLTSIHIHNDRSLLLRCWKCPVVMCFIVRKSRVQMVGIKHVTIGNRWYSSTC